MTPYEFITKWRASELKERSASQEHFIDLCRLLGEPTPAEADPSGETYCFERGARKDTGGDGWADVWKRHHFAWEYKGRRADLDAAFEQLRQYALALENPPLLIVSDMVRFRIRTNWTNSVSRTHEFDLDDLGDAATRDKLKWAFSHPERLRPGETRQSLTERVAASFATVAQALRARGHDPHAVAHFVNRLVFCMFADGRLAQLTNACERERYDDLERAGLIKTFEFCVELSWNVLKDLLFYEGHEVKVPRAAIRKSFEVDYIDEDDCETLLDALDKRNLLSHTYWSEVAREAEALIKERYHPVLVRLYATLEAKRTT